MTHNYALNPRQLFFFEHGGMGESDGFHIKKRSRNDSPPLIDPVKLPIPDQDFIKHRGDADKYTFTGKRDADLLRAALVRAGVDDQQGPGNFLEFGCAHARVLRWFADWTQHGEGWGVDLNSAMIFWCHQNLSPTFHFSVSTTIPKLSFEDHFFSAIFAMSVFTHIDDLYLSWICELRRILRPGGLLYFTLHDEEAAKIEKEGEFAPHQRRVKSAAYNEFLEQDSDFCSVDRDWRSLSSFRREYLVDHLSNYFEVIEFVGRALGLSQSAVVLKRK